MGNQLTARAPSQILSVESYLNELVDFEFEGNLGSTRFFKVAKAGHKEGSVVVKVFAINDPSLLLKEYKLQVDQIRTQLQHATNCLPYQRTTVPPELSDRAALLFRQYVKDSLYDRISTRPFLIPIEKKWMTFQLLCALNQCHKAKVCHGDIKTENVLVTSWNWVFLSDFASAFKPTFMCADNPEDFNFFFDTSRRRVCNIAPERFLASSSALSRVRQAGEMVIQGSEVTGSKPVVSGGSSASSGWEPLEPSMDVFSLGCVVFELFAEGKPLFDYSELLAFTVDQHDPREKIESIEDGDIRDLVKSMTQLNPKNRKSAEEYLVEQKGKAFPDYFYSYLKLYLQRFAVPPMMTKDESVLRLRRDLDVILEGMEASSSSSSRANNACLVILVSLVTSAQRNLFHLESKMASIDLLDAIAALVEAEIVLDRILPSLLFMVGDPFPRVRARAIGAIANVLSLVVSLPRGEANVFPEYVFPAINEVSQDEEVHVRVAFAQNVSSLAESAMRFLEMDHRTRATSPDKESSPSSPVADVPPADVVVKAVVAPEADVRALHDFFQNKVVSLLTDSDNAVRRSVVENGVSRLCVFFGRQKANDVVLSHLITFLNDKNDWQLRGAFFKVIAGVSAYVGWQAAEMLKPLLLQGLGDSEDAVIGETMRALMDMAEAGLIQKPLLQDLLSEVVPFLSHPNVWLRQGAVGFVSATASALSAADVHCLLLPVLRPFLRRQILRPREPFVLLSVLVDPVPQSVYDWIVRSTVSLADFIDHLQDRQLVRNLTRPGQIPAYGEPEDASLLQLSQKLGNLGMTDAVEDQILGMKDFLLRRHRHERSIHNALQEAGAATDAAASPPPAGVINLARVEFANVTRRHADLNSPKFSERSGGGVRPGSRRSRSPLPNGSSGDGRDGSHLEDGRYLASSPRLSSPLGGSAPNLAHAPSSSSSPVPSSAPSPRPARDGTPSTPRGRDSPAPLTGTTTSATQIKYPACRHDIHALVMGRRDAFARKQATLDLLESRLKETKSPPAGWKPKGKLVAHIHEHRLSVNRVILDSPHKRLATCSNDGSVKLFDASKLDGKSATNRSKWTYNKQGGRIKGLAFVQGGAAIASCSDANSIHVIHTERNSLSVAKEIETASVGVVVDALRFDAAAQNVVAFATAAGKIAGWDLRQPESSTVWCLQNDPRLGLVTSIAVDPKSDWIAVGTSNGNIVCWDMRFHLPIASIAHPTDARVRRLIVHPTEPSWIISAHQGNNEISFWDLETGHRQVTLWASTASALSQTQATHHFVQGMYCAAADNYAFLLSGGSDMRLRLWDISNPKDSAIVAHAANDPRDRAAVSYQTKIIEGTSVHQEMYSKQRGNASADDGPRGASGSYLDAPSPGHHDVITDVKVCLGLQSLAITSSRDGVVKVWK